MHSMFSWSDEGERGKVAVVRRTASMHVFRTPLSSSCASLVCTEEYIPVRLRAAEKNIRRHVQYGYAWLNQCTLLHVEKSIPE